MKLIIFLLLIPLVSCAINETIKFKSDELFIGVNWEKLSPDQFRVLKESSEDYFAVLEGKKPIYAKLDENRFVLDGGTRFYDGYKYRLTVVMSMSSFGDVRGYAYGPSIQYEESFAPGNISKLSNIKMYTSESLGELLNWNKL
ncbi:hypothetical protein [Teredinibacter sp. KSP-S5-2]|uniref:hypothetical protein n=1 Tax=Teredinibacter sp. KSP-S5-2 TaxID=3034506 RepID=UPI0029351638|nr:hypothetical protein [Teredinibacter sp. KSP-S5-2]WNO10058.1 hypothetical protein P5V12_02620 [Teredinibacter sp. KSP-S5-2]